MKTIYYLLLLIATILQFTIASSAQLPDTWTQKASVGVLTRHSSAGFTIGNKGYIGTGENYISTYNNQDLEDFWEYNAATDVWTQKANFGGGKRCRAVGFSIGAKGYIGTGKNLYNGLPGIIDFWEYDTTSNVWTRKADFGGGIRQYAVGFSIGNKGYIGTGTGFSYQNDFWEYNPSNDTWTQKANFGGAPRIWAVGFSIGPKGFIGTGMGWNSIYTDQYYKDFWEYDPATDTWTQKADFGGTKRTNAVGFGIGSKGYIGTGADTTWNLKNDFWEYNPATDTWTQRSNFGGTARYDAVGFSIGYKGYIGTGYDNWVLGSRNDFWEYTPACVIPNPPTNTTPPASQNICFGNSTTLSANGIGNLGWYTAPIGGTWLGGGTSYTTPVLIANTTYYVQDSTSCGASAIRTATAVNVNSLPIPTITGSTNLCVNSGYYIYTTQPGMNNYMWTVSSGGLINYGSGTNQIQVTWICAGSQTVNVNYTNGSGCTAIAPTVLNVTVNPLPGNAGVITGISTACAGDNDIPYFVAPVPDAISYVWILPFHVTISSGAGMNSITVNYDTNAVSGNVSVYGNNLCGNGTISQVFPVTVNPIPLAPIITNTGNLLLSNAPMGNQWYYEGMLLIGDTSQTYFAPYNGYYWDVLTINGCSSDTSSHLLIFPEGITGNGNTGKFLVYPNPASDLLFIRSQMPVSTGDKWVRIYSMTGEPVLSSVFSGDIQKLDISMMEKGVYFVKIESSDHFQVQKLVIR